VPSGLTCVVIVGAFWAGELVGQGSAFRAIVAHWADDGHHRLIFTIVAWKQGSALFHLGHSGATWPKLHVFAKRFLKYNYIIVKSYFD